MEVYKSKHRPKLKNWSRDGFAGDRNFEFKRLHTIEHGTKSVDCMNAKMLNLNQFRENFEAPNVPCIIANIPAVDGWAATSQWQLSTLRDKYKNRLFKIGEDDDGYKIKSKMKYYIEYFKHNKDDSPLYMFDGNFEDDQYSKGLLHDFKVPSFFPEDLFSLMGEEKRPPYRWFLMGPERSGTTVHLDPLGTSAWNTLISGHKRWVLFPPNTPKDVAKGIDVLLKGEDDESINYFVDLLPRIKAKHGNDIEIFEVIQNPGDTIFVPGGWWHGVINLDDTIAVTQVS
jgi:histone arginine demethylase JMJD6